MVTRAGTCKKCKIKELIDSGCCFLLPNRVLCLLLRRRIGWESNEVILAALLQQRATLWLPLWRRRFSTPWLMPVWEENPYRSLKIFHSTCFLAGWLLTWCEEIFSLLALCLLNFVAITFREWLHHDTSGKICHCLRKIVFKFLKIIRNNFH